MKIKIEYSDPHAQKLLGEMKCFCINKYTYHIMDNKK